MGAEMQPAHHTPSLEPRHRMAPTQSTGHLFLISQRCHINQGQPLEMEKEKELGSKQGSRAVKRASPRFKLIPEFRGKRHTDPYESLKELTAPTHHGVGVAPSSLSPPSKADARLGTSQSWLRETLGQCRGCGPQGLSALNSPLIHTKREAGYQPGGH